MNADALARRLGSVAMLAAVSGSGVWTRPFPPVGMKDRRPGSTWTISPGPDEPIGPMGLAGEEAGEPTAMVGLTVGATTRGLELEVELGTVVEPQPAKAMDASTRATRIARVAP